MDHLPHDIDILISSVNMLLRDEEYDTLSQICHAFNCDEHVLTARLQRHGYVYSPEQRQIRPLGYDQ